ncbi:MAG: hypothetical protein IK122_00880 [Alphaproteobacteria bacterium]|nr:hypothetical protein [Alphaproteobacteria bacterium]MBR6502604.1 hypothetical protein [Clostridia bacterium]
MKTRKYYGANYYDHFNPMYAVVTGQMDDGTLVYTKIATNPDGSLEIDEYGEYVLELDEQYSRTIKHGCNVFFHF